MVSANHLLMVFIAIEMASMPSYAMTAFLKNRRAGSEAALKYVLYGAATAGVMLYGISLLVGTFGTGQLDELAVLMMNQLRTDGFSPMLIAGIVLFFVGLGFKLAVVPFHFWLPDVFEGASAEVAAFLSVASKMAAFGLLLRIVDLLPAFNGENVWQEPLSWALIVSAALTATLGNLAALTQTNLETASRVFHAGPCGIHAHGRGNADGCRAWGRALLHAAVSVDESGCVRGCGDDSQSNGKRNIGVVPRADATLADLSRGVGDLLGQSTRVAPLSRVCSEVPNLQRTL